jgi:hypothetical protein
MTVSMGDGLEHRQTLFAIAFEAWFAGSSYVTAILESIAPISAAYSWRGTAAHRRNMGIEGMAYSAPSPMQNRPEC